MVVWAVIMAVMGAACGVGVVMVTRDVGYGLLAAFVAVGVLCEVRRACVRWAHAEV